MKVISEIRGALFLAICSLLCGTAARAQPVGDCETGAAVAYLDVNNVRAAIFNTGGLHYREDIQAYEIPKGSGVHAVHRTSLWVGGLIEDELHTAASTYGPWEFWPGPLDAEGNPPEDCSAYDRIFKISRADILRYNEAEEVTLDLREWPVGWGAPVMDGDGVPGNYNLRGGDRPALVGDQMLWWVMNDRGNEHLWSSRQASASAAPLGLSVRAAAFAYYAPSEVFANTTFYRYRLSYKGKAPLEEAWLGIFVDPDLGASTDDYVGSDTTLAMGFAYNGRSTDEEYGERPPALGVTLFQGPVINPDGRDNDADGRVDEPGERAGMQKFIISISDVTRLGDAINGVEAYNMLRGLWRDGRPITVGGSGAFEDGPPADFVWPGDPVAGAFWSAVNIDGEGTEIAPTDYRFLLSAGPFRMTPDVEQEVIFGIIWAQGEDRFDSVRKLRSHVAHIRSAFEEIIEPDTTLILRRPPDLPAQHGLGRSHPNPFRDRTTISYELAREGPVRLEVFDLLGRRVATLLDEVQVAGSYEVAFDGTGLPSGLYIYRLTVEGHLIGTGTMMRIG